MLEGLEDDGDQPIRAAAMETLIQVTGGAVSESTVYPVTIAIPASLTDAASDILENCLDNSSGMKPDDVDAEDYLFPGQVTLG